MWLVFYANPSGPASCKGRIPLPLLSAHVSSDLGWVIKPADGFGTECEAKRFSYRNIDVKNRREGLRVLGLHPLKDFAGGPHAKPGRRL